MFLCIEANSVSRAARSRGGSVSVRVLGGEQILMTLVVDSAEGDPERLQQSVSVEDVRRLAVRDHPTGERECASRAHIRNDTR